MISTGREAELEPEPPGPYLSFPEREPPATGIFYVEPEPGRGTSLDRDPAPEPNKKINLNLNHGVGKVALSAYESVPPL